MRRKRSLMIIIFALLAVQLWAQAETKQAETKINTIQWQSWSDAVFDQAKRENKFVLLDLEAAWCHWCHVMAETTYKDPHVASLIQSRYLAVRVDQDSRPDLSSRYEDYGWPATIVFDAAGTEIIKRSGYIPPQEMASVLRAIIDDPTPGPSVRPEPELSFGDSSALSPALKTQLLKTYLAQYDHQHGGWGFEQKFFEWNSVEYAIMRARAGDGQVEEMAQQTLNAQLKLVDRVWGGVYQYSVGGDWNEPHFEKIMAMQAEDLRIYAIAYEQWHDPAYLKAAVQIHHFLTTFLMSPEGAFYTSQDADLIAGKHSAEYFQLDNRGRRKLGIPRIDKHVYARENGWAINALAALYGATGEQSYLNEAKRAVRWVTQNRSLGEGGFRHDAHDVAGPYMGDTLAMGRAFLHLYGVTGDRAWLAQAELAAKFIKRNFKNAKAGFVTAKRPTDRAYSPRPERDENVWMARFVNLLFHYTGDPTYREMANHAMKYLAVPQVANTFPIAGALIADYEMTHGPVHIAVVGHKDSREALALFQAAASYPSGYERLEWVDAREARMPNPDVQYPNLQRVAAFICSEHTCSPPIYRPGQIRPRVDEMNEVWIGIAAAKSPED